MIDVKNIYYSDNMAYFDKRSGNIVLSQEDKEMFGKIGSNFQQTGGIATPTANNIHKWVLNGNTNSEIDKLDLERSQDLEDLKKDEYYNR